MTMTQSSLKTKLLRKLKRLEPVQLWEIYREITAQKQRRWQSLSECFWDFVERQQDVAYMIGYKHGQKTAWDWAYSEWLVWASHEMECEIEGNEEYLLQNFVPPPEGPEDYGARTFRMDFERALQAAEGQGDPPLHLRRWYDRWVC